MRLRHLYTGELTWRELGVYLRGLPPASRLRAALTGSPPWTTGDHILADVYDVLTGANWQRSGDRTLPRPKPYPRPGHNARRDEAAHRRARDAARERARAHRAAVEAGHLT